MEGNKGWCKHKCLYYASLDNASLSASSLNLVVAWTGRAGCDSMLEMRRKCERKCPWRNFEWKSNWNRFSSEWMGRWFTSLVIFARAFILSYFSRRSTRFLQVLVSKKETKIISSPRIKISVNDRILLLNRETNKAINRLNSALTQFSKPNFPLFPPFPPLFLISYRIRYRGFSLRENSKSSTFNFSMSVEQNFAINF